MRLTPMVAVTTVLCVGIGTVGIAALVFIGSYNGMVSRQQTVNSAWAQVQNVYQRRADLVPNLVNTVKGAANFEQSTLVAVANARASVGQVKLSANQAPQTAAELQKFQQAQDGLSSALSRLMVVVEKYPDLKANRNFMDLQAQLEGTENRISVERGKFNGAVQTYNTSIQTFPRNILAGMFGFQPRAYFQAAEGAEKAPEVKF